MFLRYLSIVWLVLVLLVDKIYLSDELRSSRFRLDLLRSNVFEGINQETTTASTEECPGRGKCVPSVQCPAHVRDNFLQHQCKLAKGSRTGVCCTTGQNHTSETDLKTRTSRFIEEEDFIRARSNSKEQLSQWIEREMSITSNAGHPTIVDRNMPSFGHYQSNRVGDLDVITPLGRGALQNLFETEALKHRQVISMEQVELGLIASPGHDAFCPPPPVCDPSFIFRSVDGSCNNLQHTGWGAINTPYERLLPPSYSDGLWTPRVSAMDGRPLPSARAVCSSMLPDLDLPSDRHNLMLMQFGQFVAHDISSAVMMTFPNGSAISCCLPDGSGHLPVELQHFGCDVIHIPERDVFFQKFGQSCMNFVRTALAPSHDCTLGYAKQMNGVTHFLDMSQIYGSSEAKLRSLRSREGGRLRVFRDFGRDLPPLTSSREDCITMDSDSACFDSGDSHANQMITLVALHTLWTREHNRVAGTLQRLNPAWSDQQLFLEARRIVLAEYQHVVYNELLPHIIGPDAMAEFDLKPTSQAQFSTDYDPDVNPSLTAEFAVAAYRFGHSIVDGKINIPNGEKLYEAVSIPEVMFHPSRMRLRHYYDRLLNGMTQQPMQAVDPSISESLTRYMFHAGSPFGLDLASINIQRGRDHGLRGYNDYRKLGGLPTIQDFTEFAGKAGRKLSSLYSTPDDLDLWIGGLLERAAPSAIVGPTFRDIIADQFSRLRKGDRHFYEHGPDVNPEHFSNVQLAEIKKTTLARLICDNSDGIELTHQSRDAFVLPSFKGNEFISCNSISIPRMDLSRWREI